ncbi:hypothetical protein H920_15335 [Fukomys damarensis]|uniref:Uncharacterized protein n=1 Tax=Fukomys damarensis TaxID=885580 RepID=A0A091CZ59_FUKDA|nr:hypothetical protein H920_15335 [Fukomys damarensis]
MSSVQKTPDGSDTMPEITVKIIGSKYFRCLVEKPKNRQEENLQAGTLVALKKPTMDTTGWAEREPLAPPKPSAQHTGNLPGDGDQQGSKHRDNAPQPEDNQQLPAGTCSSTYVDGRISHHANVYCSSVPTGDQSLSYMHDLPRGKLRRWSMEQRAGGHTCQPEDIAPKASEMTREDAFLLTLVKRELKPHPLSSSLLDQLQEELKAMDPLSSGFLLQPHLSCLLLRQEIPLQGPTVQLLCQRFSRSGSPKMVCHLALLNRALLRSLPCATRIIVKGLSVFEVRKGILSTLPQPSDNDQSLLEILKMVLQTASRHLNIENLNLNFRREDRSFSGCLPPPKVRAICGKHGLYLTLSLLEILLNHQDLGYQDEIKWQNFVELLKRASLDLLSGLPTGKYEQEVPASPGQSEVPEVPQSQTEHQTAEEELQPKNPPAETSALEDSLSPLKIRPVSQPLLSSAMKNGSEEHKETWIDRFRKLENALYLCDLSNTGNLEKERARRLIHNYNLIYNLSLSPQKIDQALRRFCSGENLLLEPALRYLKEL